MEVRLCVATGQNAGQIVPIRGPKFYIGRSEDCQLRPRSDTVSRHHCVLLFESDCLVTRDLGSKNGTFVNDRRIHPEVELRSGDRLRVGHLEFEVQIGGEADGKQKPNGHSLQETAMPATAATNRLNDEDSKFEEWLAGLESASVTKTGPVEHTPEDEPDPEAEVGVQKEAGKLAAPAAGKPAPDHVPSSSRGAAFWNKKPAAQNSGNAAGKALKELLRKR